MDSNQPQSQQSVEEHTGHAGQHPAPRVALLGWCERYTEVTEGHFAFWHKNLLGLTTSRVFNIYPIPLRGQKLALAIYQPKIGESFELRFRRREGSLDFAIKVNLSAQKIEDAESGGIEFPEGAVLPGWQFSVTEIGEDVAVVSEPGEFLVYYSSSEGEVLLGGLVFFHAPVPPLKQEDIAAILSDPMAAKLIRLKYACKSCGGELKTYTAIERNSKLELEGWCWYEELPEKFQCNCGKTNLSLKFLKTGFHGMLQRRLAPSASKVYETVRYYERSALEEQCREFRRLLDSTPVEEKLQQFIKDHPIFFSRFSAAKIIPKPPSLTMYKMDFGILTKQRELLLVEIERADLPLTKADGGVRAELTHAVDQVRQSLQVFDEHRAAALQCIGLKLEDVATIHGVVIAGRTPKNDELARRIRTLAWKDIEFFTYDDLVSNVVEMVRHIATT